MTSRTTISTTTAMSRTAETCRAQRYSDGGWRSSVMPADREQSPVHEPGDEDGATDEAEQVAGGAEEDELEGLTVSSASAGRGGVRPARREWRRGGRPCTPSVYGAVRRASSEGAYGCSGSRTDVVSCVGTRGPHRVGHHRVAAANGCAGCHDPSHDLACDRVTGASRSQGADDRHPPAGSWNVPRRSHPRGSHRARRAQPPAPPPARARHGPRPRTSRS